VEAADVLVYDAWAAGTGASELIEDVRDLHPDKPVVLTTPGMMLNWAETAGIHRVTPVAWAPTTDDLVAAIEAALENARANPPVPRPAPKSAPQPAVRSGW
jgi:DNA-binding NtrC family response regulator